MIWYYLDKNKLTKLNGSQNCDFKRNYLKKKKLKMKQGNWSMFLWMVHHSFKSELIALFWMYRNILCAVWSYDPLHQQSTWKWKYENMMKTFNGRVRNGNVSENFDYLYDLRLGINFRQYMFKGNYLFWQIEMVMWKCGLCNKCVNQF